MTEKNEKVILIEYEYLLQANTAQARGDKEVFQSVMEAIRQDLQNQYSDDVEGKISRWVEVTGFLMFHQSKSVEFYMQAKMLYRDGYYEAAIMMVRSICEMACYDLLRSVSHPFGSEKDMEKVNFRRLVNHLLQINSISQSAFGLLSTIYDIGNNYVHPKSSQSPKHDGLESLRKLGLALFEIYGVKTNSELIPGTVIQTAYSTFPDIAKWYHYGMDVFPTPEAAMHGSIPSTKRDNVTGSINLQGAIYDSNTKWPEGFDPEKAGAKKIDE